MTLENISPQSLSFDSLSHSPSTSSAARTLENTEEGPYDTETSVGEIQIKYPSD